METKFKVGDKVYWVDNSFNEREGIIESFDEVFINVRSEKGTIWTFYLDGKRYNIDKIPRLSFTPYTIEFKVFSQERSLPQIEVDTLVYVRNGENYLWDMRYFSHFENDKMFTFVNQEKSTKTKATHIWKYWSLENPLLNNNL